MNPYPDVEEALALLLDDLTPGEVVTQAREIPDRVPLIRCTRIGGPDDRFTDRARVEVLAYAGTRAEARTLSEQARQILLAYPHATDSGVIDYVETEVGPHDSESRDTGRMRRWRAVYRVSVRRRN